MSSSAENLKQEGMRLFNLGANDEALEHFERALDQCIQSGDTLQAAEIQNNIGVVHRTEGRLAEAEAALVAAKQAFSEAGDKDREAQTVGNLAPLYIKQGKHEEAMEAYREASRLFGEVNDHDRRGEILMALGLLQFDTGQRQEGLMNYESGIMLIKKPSPKQKRLRSLLKFKSRLMGK